MGVDNGSAAFNLAVVQEALGQAVKEALAGRPYAWLEERSGISESMISRLVAGKVTKVTLDHVVTLEDALNVKRGTLLRRAGLVGDLQTPREVLEADPTLSAPQRRIVLALYDTCVRVSADERGADSSEASPRRPATAKRTRRS